MTNTAFLDRSDRYTAQGRQFVFFSFDESFIGTNGRSVYWYPRRREPVLRMIELDESDDSTMRSRCNGFSWLSQLRW